MNLSQENKVFLVTGVTEQRLGKLTQQNEIQQHLKTWALFSEI